MNHTQSIITAISTLGLLVASGCAEGPVGQRDFDVTEEEADTQVDPVAAFLETHEVATELTRVYCRLDVATPDCRTLVRYRAIDGGALVDSFRITFSSPIAQSGGTELFLASGEGRFERFTDASVDGEPTFESAGDLEAIVGEPDGSGTEAVAILGIEFGALVADLTFDGEQALLEGEIVSDDGNTPFLRSYPRLVPQATPPSDAPAE